MTSPNLCQVFFFVCFCSSQVFETLHDGNLQWSLRFRVSFTEFQGHTSFGKVSLVVWSGLVEWPKLATKCIRLTSLFMTSWPSRQPLFYAMRKVEKETESLRMKIKFLMNLCRHKQTRWDPSDPSYKKRNERRDALLQVTELFGWRDRMNLLCLY